MMPWRGIFLRPKSVRSKRRDTPEDQAKYLLQKFSSDKGAAIKAANAVKKHATKPETIRFWEQVVNCLHNSGLQRRRA